MSYGMKVSKAGYNVLTTGNVNLSFNSDLATHSIFNVASASIEGSGDPYVDVTHSLGFVPKVWVFLLQNDGEDYISRVPIDLGWSSGSLDYYIDDTKVRIEAEDTSEDYTFKVVIFTRSPNI